ncbi:hypothetical protein [Pseudoruegeria sp. HB172150]|uniref:hypothetical protein n=1 Tax=Pseudoruegeria sp. HB172150 TaxID=2721164 RepID=UPI001557075B|nr:hypothetical protein [Pseudoruegeria sp. HB172150]
MALRRWEELGGEEQLALREAYAPAQDSEPGTCDMTLKVDRFAAYLAERGVAFSADSLRRKG